MSFKERLKELRMENEVKQEVLAKSLNVAVSTISMYEMGNREPAIDMLIKLADYFGVSVDYLIGVTDKRERNK